MDQNHGNLYLIPTLLGDNPPLEVLPISIKKVIEMLDDYIVENEKTARRFIKKMSSRKSQSSLNLRLLNKYTQESELHGYLDPCLSGINMGLLSEAGCPAIADPGADVVRLAHQLNIKVVPMVGPSSIILAIMSSGMNGQNFTFNGYLPIDNTERKRTLKKLEKLSSDMNQSQIFIETPYRNNKIIEESLKVLQPSTRFCIAADLTLPSQFIKTKTIAEWKNHVQDFHKRPSIFIIHKD